MSGLNPDGLGNSETFNQIEGDSVTTEEIENDAAPVSYIVYNDGGTYTGLPQVSYGSKVTGTEIANVINEITRNQLKPQGDAKEGAGRVRIKRGDYTWDNDILLPMGTRLQGEGHTHAYPPSNTQQGTNSFPQTVPQTRLNAQSNVSIVPPNVDSDLIPFNSIEWLQLYGPGHDSAGSVAIDSTGGSNEWDHLTIRDNAIHEWESGVDITATENMVSLEWNHIVEFGNNGNGVGISRGGKFNTVHNNSVFSNYQPNLFIDIAGTDKTVYGNEFVIAGGVGTAGVRIKDDSRFMYNHLQLSTSPGPAIDVSNTRRATVALNSLQDIGTSRENGIIMGGSSPGSVANRVLYNVFSGGWDTCIKHDSAAGDNKIHGNIEDGNANTFILEDGANGASDDSLRDNHPANKVTIQNNPTRLRHHDTVILSSAPSASNYDAGDAGVAILDTSTSPVEEYYVDYDGALIGAL